MNEERNEEREARAAVKATIRPYKPAIKSLAIFLLGASCLSLTLGAWLLALVFGCCFVAAPLGLAVWISRKMPAGDLERSIFPMALEHSGVGPSRIPKRLLFLFWSSRIILVPFARAKEYVRAAKQGEEGIEWMLEQLGSSNSFDRWRALVTLTQMREERVVPALSRALGDPNASVREVAAKGLSTFGRSDALADALGDDADDFVWLHAAAAASAAQGRTEVPEWRAVRLGNSIPAAGDFGENGWDESRASAIGTLPIEATEGLVRELLTRQPQFAIPALTSVGKQRTEAAREFLISLLEDARPNVVRAAIFGLGKTKDRLAVPTLEHLHREHGDEDVRRVAGLIAKTLGRTPD